MTSIQQQLAHGWRIHQAGRYADAEAIYRRVLSQAPRQASGWCYLGMVLHDQRRYSEAREAYQRALELQADFPIALNNLGNTLRYLDEVEQADACFQRAIDLKPEYVNAYKNRGTLHVWCGELDRGLEYYQQAMRLNPEDAELHRNLGVLYLLRGDFEQGWPEYRWRWRVGDLHRPRIDIPIWDGEDIDGKSILLSAEQGLGDTLNFVRFAATLRGRGARTMVYCQPQLLALLQQASNIGPVYPNNLALAQQFDYQCSLLDVADILRVEAQSIPWEGPYIRPSDGLVEYWRQRLGNAPGRRRIGIAWQGNRDHQADMFRSIPLSYFRPLAELPDVELIVLQNGHGLEQLDAWKGPPVTRLDERVDQSGGAFMDTAAIMQSLDLVITSDTAIAHLAGAGGVATWLALNYVPDWRWMLEGSETPWYPSLTLFRQSRRGDWSSLFADMAMRLQQESSRLS